MRIYYIIFINIPNLISKTSTILKRIIKMEIPRPIKLNFTELRNERKKSNSHSALEGFLNGDESKYNVKQLEWLCCYSNKTKEELIVKCIDDKMYGDLLGCQIAINASRQGTKDEELQITTCNITSSKCGILIENLSSSAFRPTKSGEIFSNKEFKKAFKEEKILKNDCLKSFDARISGKISGWMFAKVVLGSGGHQDNVFEEAHMFCNWVVNCGKKDELFVVLIDTDLISKFNDLREKYKNVLNILIGNHEEIQQYFIDRYYV
jgi:hypothetical protein